jgi:hypothetical protein
MNEHKANLVNRVVQELDLDRTEQNLAIIYLTLKHASQELSQLQKEGLSYPYPSFEEKTRSYYEDNPRPGP